MEVLHPHCAGLDVHKDTVMACVRHMAGGTVRRKVRTFKTTTKDLGPDHFDRRAKAAQTRRLVARLHNLSYAVHITPLPA